MKIENTHAKLSASGAKKWINCPLSVTMEERIPEKTSEYADEGTSAHTLGELKIKLALKKTLGENITRVRYHDLIKNLKIDKDMEDYTDTYKDYVVERFNAARSVTKDAIILLEQKLDYSHIAPKGFGTGDVVIIADDTIEIIDFKYGKGVCVSAVDNPQLMLYALGAIKEHSMLYDIQNVIMTIHQPRIDNINSHNISVVDLLAWGESIKEVAIKAFNSEGECNAGIHCNEAFCRARPICRTYSEKLQGMAKYDFLAGMYLNDYEIAEILDVAESLASWSKLVKDYALGRALEGTKYPGFKLVEGRSNRTYVDEEQVVKTLIDAGYLAEDIQNTKIKGITEMERILGKNNFSKVLANYIIKPTGSPTLVKSEDRRPELNTLSQIQEDFNLI